VELHVYEGDEQGPNSNDITIGFDATFLLYASLEVARPIANGRMFGGPMTPVLTGVPVAGAAYLDKPNKACYFIFPDLSVRHEGWYNLKFSLFESVKNSGDGHPQKPVVIAPSHHEGKPIGSHEDLVNLTFVRSEKFQVFSAKKFPGLDSSTDMSRCIAEQGCRVRIRREVRQRKHRAGKEEHNEDEEMQSSRGPSEAPSHNLAPSYHARSMSRSSQPGNHHETGQYPRTSPDTSQTLPPINVPPSPKAQAPSPHPTATPPPPQQQQPQPPPPLQPLQSLQPLQPIQPPLQPPLHHPSQLTTKSLPAPKLESFSEVERKLACYTMLLGRPPVQNVLPSPSPQLPSSVGTSNPKTSMPSYPIIPSRHSLPFQPISPCHPLPSFAYNRTLPPPKPSYDPTARKWNLPEPAGPQKRSHSAHTFPETIALKSGARPDTIPLKPQPLSLTPLSGSSGGNPWSETLIEPDNGEHNDSDDGEESEDSLMNGPYTYKRADGSIGNKVALHIKHGALAKRRF
jgi:Velvet factor